MISEETPILDSVFADLAPNAAEVSDIISEGMPLSEIYWYFVPLTYSELLDWTQEAMP